jgi:hypothetical protein
MALVARCSCTSLQHVEVQHYMKQADDQQQLQRYPEAQLHSYSMTDSGEKG